MIKSPRGDKTQLATLLLAAEPQTNRLGVFIAASGALILSTLIAVLVGGQLAQYVSPRIMKLAAGIGFTAIEVWVLIDARG
ncbi:MAG: TMEM165/GDT1 family protein [Nitrospirae bacterium]|jgi:putative Ca2+/H+ antiporter (TMEM165/GDT1 family)|nr:TMEM165/GDT1 family protein [Nitrospirota bacterium]